MAKRFVERNLKAPATAEWPGVFDREDQATSLGRNRYKIRSWVDSKNALGVLIRIHYTAIVVQDNSDRDIWTLESLDMNE